jgi:acyl-CoA thioester hydrolase
MRFSHSLKVSADDIDEQGHVNNVAYLRWIQDVAVAHWRDAATPEQIEKYSWITLRHEIDYKKQAFENEEITATTWVGEWTQVTCERFSEISRDGELLAKGRTIWCMIDKRSGRPTRIAKDLVERFI